MLAMTASLAPTSLAPASLSRSRITRVSRSLRSQSGPQGASPSRPGASGVMVPASLAAVLLLVAVVVAPERPQDQEAICQRHNGVDACRVW